MLHSTSCPIAYLTPFLFNIPFILFPPKGKHYYQLNTETRSFFLPSLPGWESQCLGWFKLSVVFSFRTSCSSCGISFWVSIRCFCYPCWPLASSAYAGKIYTASCHKTLLRPSYLICQPFKWYHYFRWHSLSKADNKWTHSFKAILEFYSSDIGRPIVVKCRNVE